MNKLKNNENIQEYINYEARIISEDIDINDIKRIIELLQEIIQYFDNRKDEKMLKYYKNKLKIFFENNFIKNIIFKYSITNNTDKKKEINNELFQSKLHFEVDSLKNQEKLKLSNINNKLQLKNIRVCNSINSQTNKLKNRLNQRKKINSYKRSMNNTIEIEKNSKTVEKKYITISRQIIESDENN